jgi:hypothetical protein
VAVGTPPFGSDVISTVVGTLTMNVVTTIEIPISTEMRRKNVEIIEPESKFIRRYAAALSFGYLILFSSEYNC